MVVELNRNAFGRTAGGEAVTEYVLKSAAIEVGVVDYGATITSIKTKDKSGSTDDIVTGFTSVAGYEKYPKFFGATAGRCCNRINKGKFVLNGSTYSLPINNGPNSLHGGNIGFDKRMWTVEIEGSDVVMRLTSADGDQGYPGTLHATTRFSLEDSELCIRYSATTDKDTIVNLTNHSYFNLGGHSSWTTLEDHQIVINSDRITPVDATLIPTGEIRSVEGTIFDLREPTPLTKERLDAVPGGYDHNFCLSSDGNRRLAARVHHAPSGRTLTVETDQPGMQFYTGNFLEGIPSKDGGTYGKQTCFCLETQNWPDAINHDSFPNVILRAGAIYDHRTWLTFSVSK